MKKLIIIAPIVCLLSCKSNIENNDSNSNGNILNCKTSSIYSLTSNRGSNCSEIKDAFVEFNMKASDAFNTNDYFRAVVLDYFSSNSTDPVLRYKVVSDKMRGLKSSFDNTASILGVIRLLAKQYGNDDQAYLLAFSSIGVSATSAYQLEQYIKNNY